MSIPRNVTLLGSTGSIGTQTLDVCRKHNIKVKALTANKSGKLLCEQAREFNPEYVCIADPLCYDYVSKITVCKRYCNVGKAVCGYPCI